MAKQVVFDIVLRNGQAVTDAKELREAIKASREELAKLALAGKDTSAVTRELGQLKAAQKALSDETRKATREFTVSSDKGKRSYRALQAQLTNLKNEFKDLGEEAREGIAGRNLQARIRRLNGELTRIDRTLGNNQRNVGNYSSALKGLGGALLGGLAIGGFAELVQAGTQAVSEATRKFAEFEDTISLLGAVSGASGDTLRELSQDARRLGEETQFTATEVADLQVEYAKLGLRPAEILKATADTLNLAAIAQADLGRTAEVSGATLRGFQLDVSEMGRVTDVLAKSFSSSALDLEKFSTAMSAVAPVAVNAGVSLEQATAQLGILVDRGIDASTAGTALRNIYLDLAGLGLTYDEALQQINSSTDKNAKAFELFGKRGATVAATLASTEKEVDALNKTLQDSEGFATRAGKAITDNLSGDLKRLDSAFEGLQINFADTFDKSLRNAIQGVTDLTSAVSDYIKTPVSEELREEQSEFSALITALKNTTAGQEVRNTLIDELQTKYPQYLKNINLENAGAKELSGLLEDVNKQFTRKILLQEQEEKLTELSKRRLDTIKEIARAEKNLAQNGRFKTTSTIGGTERVDRQKVLEGQQRKLREIDAEFEQLLQSGNELEKRLFGLGSNENRVIFDDLSEDLKVFETTVTEVTETTEEEAEKISAAVIKVAEGSIAFLKSEISELKKEIETSNLPDNVIAEKLQEITDYSVQLAAAEENLLRLRGVLASPTIQTRSLPGSVSSDGTSGTVGPAESTSSQVERLGGNIAQRAAEKGEEAGISFRDNFLRAVGVDADSEEGKNIGAAFDAVFDGVGSIIDGVADRRIEASERARDAEIRDLEAIAERRLENVVEGSDEERAIQEELAQDREKIEKKAFEQQQKIRVRSALATGALAAIQALAATTLPFPASLTALIPIGIQTAASVATIRAQQFAGGGLAGALRPGLIDVPQNIQTQPNGDNVLATVKRGEVILNRRQQAALGGTRTFRSIGVPGFNRGGIVGNMPDFATFSSTGIGQVEISDENIERIAERIGERAAEGTATGTAAGINQATQENERRNRLVAQQVA